MIILILFTYILTLHSPRICIPLIRSSHRNFVINNVTISVPVVINIIYFFVREKYCNCLFQWKWYHRIYMTDSNQQKPVTDSLKFEPAQTETLWRNFYFVTPQDQGLPYCLWLKYTNSFFYINYAILLAHRHRYKNWWWF